MGMFDKDKVFAPDGQLSKWVDDGVEFILWDAEIKTEEFETELGTTPMVHLVVAPMDAPDNRSTVSVLGEVNARKVRDKAEGDLPAVVRTAHVDTDQPQQAYVIQFVREYEAVSQKKTKAGA